MPIDAARFSPRAATHRPPADRSARLLVAAGVSTYGDWLTVVALTVLLFRLTNEPEVPAAYVLAKVAPRVFGPTPGGHLADRFGPGRVAGWCALVQALLTGAIVVCAASDAVWPIFAAVVGAQFVGSMAQPAYGATIPRVTRGDRLLRVNALYSGLFESSVLVSPALGALLLSWVQPAVLIAADAASFAVAGALMLSLRIGPATTGFSPARVGSNAARLVAADPMLRALAASFFCSGAAITALQAVLVVAAAQRFGQDATVGWLYAAVGGGGVIGSLALLRWRPAPIGAGGISAGFLLEIGPFAAFALVGGFIPALGFLAVSTCAAAVYQTRGQTALQQNVPAELLGRVNGVMRFLLYTGMLAGAVSAVALVDVVGWSALVAGTTAAAAGVYIVGLLILRVAHPRPREVTLAGLPLRHFVDQTAPSSRSSSSIGAPADLPHSLHDPS
ncbi:MAG TPA: MFS transporter [Candidatus Acidoferrales bacterium]|nr:MFS transporter [Candidatus Acidoferrales bacterium]